MSDKEQLDNIYNLLKEAGFNTMRDMLDSYKKLQEENNSLMLEIVSPNIILNLVKLDIEKARDNNYKKGSGNCIDYLHLDELYSIIEKRKNGGNQ